MSAEKIEGIMCREHNVELTWVVPDNLVFRDIMRADGRRAGEKHSQENGGKCKIEPWKEGGEA